MVMKGKDKFIMVMKGKDKYLLKQMAFLTRYSGLSTGVI